MSSLDSRPLMSPQRSATPASQRELSRSLSPVDRRKTRLERRKTTALLASHLASFVLGALVLASSLALLPAPPPAPSSSPPTSSFLSRALDSLCEIPRKRFLEARSGPNYLEAIDDAAAALPPSVHATLPISPSSSGGTAVSTSSEELSHKRPPVLGRGRLVFVGDVHGCADELERLLFEKVRFDGQNGDTLVLLGDIVSKGADSPRALGIARELGAWSVRGNHDDAALAAYDHYKRTGFVPKVSRADTGGEDFSFVENLTHADGHYLREMPWTLELPSHGAVAVHAGLVPGVAVNRQRLSDVFMMRGVVEVDGEKSGGGARREGEPSEKKPRRAATARTYRATATPGEGKLWGKVWSSSEVLNRGKHVVFGHDSRSGLQREAFATGIDTGCVDGGELTALVLPPVSSSSSSFLGKRSSSRWPQEGVELVSVKCRGVKK